MSLTPELEDPKSPLSVFMAAECPEARSLAAAFRMVGPANGDGLVPAVPAGTRVPWGTLNAAIDHRLRYRSTTGTTCRWESRSS